MSPLLGMTMNWLQLLKHLLGQRYHLPSNWLPLLALLISCIFIVVCVANGVSIAIALIFVWLIMAYALNQSGYDWSTLIDFSKKGAFSASIVIQIFLLIGWLTSMWQASGTIPTIISVGLSFLEPSLFVVCAFLLPALVSGLLGTSLGTVGTIGLVLIIIAKAGGIPADMVAGAIIAGAYVGDRNSPLSSSASLVAALTHTSVPRNIGPMFMNSLPALLVSIVLYTALSFMYPLETAESNLTEQIASTFTMTPMLWIPVAIVVALLPFKLSIRWPIGLSALAASVLAYLYQGHSVLELINMSFWGFTLPVDNPLSTIIHGGGIKVMAEPAVSIFVACAISGMLDGVGFWSSVRQLLEHAQTRSDIFVANVILSIITGGIGCSQSIATVMTHSIMRITYAKHKIQDKDVMLDFENTGIVLAPMIPWNIAAMIPTVMMDTSLTGYIPFAFYLYLLPLFHWYQLRKRSM